MKFGYIRIHMYLQIRIYLQMWIRIRIHSYLQMRKFIITQLRIYAIVITNHYESLRMRKHKFVYIRIHS